MRHLVFVALLLTTLAAATLLLPSRTPLEQTAGEHANIRVGLVFDVGGLGDKSFNDSAYAGLLRAKNRLGVTTEMIEPSGAEDRETALRLFAARGFDLVIGVGFIFSTDMNVVAKDFPHTQFACVDYAPSPHHRLPPNLAGLIFREQEGAFLVGAVAGLVSKHHAVGFVGGMDVPLIHKFQAGYTAGVHQVCSTCQVHAAYAGTTPEAFKDPAKGEALATAQISAGADVIFHAAGTTGLGVFEATRDMHAWAIGVDADQYDEMPQVMLTSMVKRVDVVVYDTIDRIVTNQFHGGLLVFGVKEGAIDYVHQGPHASHIPPAVRRRVDAIRQQIVDEKIIVPNH